MEYVAIEKQEYINLLIQIENLKHEIELLHDKLVNVAKDKGEIDE